MNEQEEFLEKWMDKTSGMSKGVMLNQRQVVNLLEAYSQSLPSLSIDVPTEEEIDKQFPTIQDSDVQSIKEITKSNANYHRKEGATWAISQDKTEELMWTCKKDDGSSEHRAWKCSEWCGEEVCQLHPIEKSQGEWISVEDRLPKENKPVLSCGIVGRQVAWYSDGIWTDTDRTLSKVTHWQPLPKPPTK